MQKTNTKASILIWAIFISLIISVTFISISTRINKNLKNNYELTESIKINNEINNIVNSGSINLNFKSQYLSNGDKLIFSSPNITIFGLNKGESHISKINEDCNIAIKILNGGPIEYKVNGASGLLIDVKAMSVNASDILTINNIAGYTKIQITSDKTSNYLSNYTDYKIIKQIGNKEVIQSKGKIKNF